MTTAASLAGPDSSAISRRDLLLGGVFGAAGIGTYLLLPKPGARAVSPEELGHVLPERVGPWAASSAGDFILPPQDEMRSSAVYDNQVTRGYLDGSNAPVMLLIAYDVSQSGMLMIHRPESCYPSAGFTILKDQDVSIPLGSGPTAQGRFLSTVRGMRTEQVLYWTRIGDTFPIDWDQQRLYIALQNLKGTIPDGALVRLSMIEPDPARALSVLQRFAALLFRTCGPAGKNLLAGPSA